MYIIIYYVGTYTAYYTNNIEKNIVWTYIYSSIGTYLSHTQRGSL